MIPQYDDDGRMDGDPEDLRYNVIPRRDVTTEQIIEQLSLMHDLGLVHWYVVDGNAYVEMPPEVWSVHQTFKGIKRVRSTIPAYDPSRHVSYIEYTQNGETSPDRVIEDTPEGVRYNPKGDRGHPEGCACHLCLPTREEKRSKGKSLSNDKQPPAASSHFADHIENPHLEKIIEINRALERKSNGKKRLNGWQWTQQKFNQDGHPVAIIAALQGTLENWDTTVKNPWAYADHIFNARQPHCIEQVHVAEAHDFKRAMDTFLQTDQGKKLVGRVAEALAMPP